MNKQYVDVINLAVLVTHPGMRYKDGQTFENESSLREDEGISSDERTMMLIKQN